MKNRVLVTLTVAIAMLFGAASLSAQVQARRAKAGAKLNLTADQRAQIQTIRQAQRAKIVELNKQSLTRVQYRSQALAIHQETRQKIENVLTPEQRAKAGKVQQKRIQRARKFARRGRV